MRRRLLALITAAVVLPMALPTAAQAKTSSGVRAKTTSGVQAKTSSDVSACTSLFRSTTTEGAGDTTPYVVTQSVPGGDFSAMWMDSVSGGTTNDLTSCTFRDRNGNGVYDWRREAVFPVKESFTVGPEFDYSKWPYEVVLKGVAQGESVCSRRAITTRSLAGVTSRSVTSTTCYTVDLLFPGE